MNARHLARIGSIASILTVVSLAPGCPVPFLPVPATENIAQEWMTLARNAAFAANEGPTAEARTFFHVSATMYEAWAAYDEEATGYFTGDHLKQPILRRTLENRAETLSHAVFAVLRSRFAALGARPADSPGRVAFDAFTAKMQRHGYVTNGGLLVRSPAQRIGSQIAGVILDYTAADQSNEENGYADTFGYTPANSAIVSNQSGTNGMAFANNWQPIAVNGGTAQSYLTPHWGAVTPFSLAPYDPNALRFDPGPPPLFGTATEAQFEEDFAAVLRFSSQMDPTSGDGAAIVNLSPRVRGVETPGEYENMGHAVNPATGQPYADALVPLGDYLRVLAVFHDGLTYSTPPPWWNEVATDIMRGAGIVDQRAANKARPRDLAYDVKLYFALNATLHDVAIAVWDVKFAYDTCRPISGIRYLSELGELPMEAGFVEIIQMGDPLAGPNDENVGKVKVRAWAGPDQGVDWILGEDWLPYQPLNFVSPPFPGYNSGHTAFSRAAAVVFESMTGDAYLPGGLGIVEVDALRFENDLSGPVPLQWATYQDMADETGLARVVCGVHIPSDVDSAKPIGAAIADQALALAQSYFAGTGTPVAEDLL